MDVIKIERTNQMFRLLYDIKGRFAVHPIQEEEAEYKLCRIRKIKTGPKGVPLAYTHDGRTLRFIHPDIRVNDTIRFEIATGKVLDYIKFDVGKTAMLTGGNNVGRVGTIMTREQHPGSFEIIHLKDARGHEFATRLSNVFVIGPDKPWVSLPKGPKGEGIKLSPVEQRQHQLDVRNNNS
eukprot:Filipodium_phascolosomae@DN2155_c0_g1_i1.p1